MLYLNGTGEHAAADIAVQVYLQNPEVLRRRHSMMVLDRVRTYESFRAGVSQVPIHRYPMMTGETWDQERATSVLLSVKLI